MKYILLASAGLLFASLTTTFCGQVTPTPLIGMPSPTPQEELGPLNEPRHVRFGMTPDDVKRAMLGKPDVVLAPDLWVYWGFRVSNDRDRQKFDTLVIYFAENHVVKYRLVERKAMQALIESVRKAARAQAVAAK